MKDTLTILKDAYALISDRNRWTTHVAARDANGLYVDPWSKNAVRFCAAGACWHVANVHGMHDSQRRSVVWAHHELRVTLGRDIAYVNDGPDGYEVICEAFRDTIVRLTPAKEPARTEEREPVNA
jgi:hypothetical protein